MPKKTYDVITIGSIMRDIFTRAHLSKVMQLRDRENQQSFLCFDYGGKLEVDEVAFTLGGGACNTAVSFARLGLSSAILGVIGEDTIGKEVLQNLKQEGIDTQFLLRSKEKKTGLSVILNSFEGERTVLAYRGANKDLVKTNVDWKNLAKTKWIYLASLCKESSSILEELPAFLKKHKIKLAWNPGSTQLALGATKLKKLLQCTDILLMNKEEAARLSQESPQYHQQEKTTHGSSMQGITYQRWHVDLTRIFKALRSYGPKTIVITDGKKGTQVYDGINVYSFGIYPQEVIDTLGAGDCFGSSFVTGLMQKNDIIYGIKLGTANAASVVSHYGAQEGLLQQKAVEKVIKKNQQLEVKTMYLG